MCRPPHGLVVEAERGELTAELEEVGQVLIRAFFPSSRPDQLEGFSQAHQALSTAMGDAVGDSLDGMQAAGGRSVMREAEHADDPVDVHEEDGNFFRNL